jgi:hypothetical protein
MRLIDDGAMRRLNAGDQSQIKLFWLLTDPFKEPYVAFTAHVNALTENKVIVTAFLVQSDKYVVPLQMVPGSGVGGIYLYDVPKSRAKDRLLVFLAMKQTSYDSILDPKVFSIQSRPVNPN